MVAVVFQLPGAEAARPEAERRAQASAETLINCILYGWLEVGLKVWFVLQNFKILQKGVLI
jgi:hypothetical protein